LSHFSRFSQVHLVIDPEIQAAADMFHAEGYDSGGGGEGLMGGGWGC
jgi:hypothetical protein